MEQKLITVNYEGIGWKSYWQIRRGTTRVSIKKDISVGLALRKGQPAFGYLGKDVSNNRSVIVFFTDGLERDGEKEDRE